MGVGKGRQLAALARAAFKEDRPVLFFTDNASLFTDFVARDLATVMRKPANELPQFIKPYIVNSSKDASILDPDFQGSGDVERVSFSGHRHRLPNVKRRLIRR